MADYRFSADQDAEENFRRRFESGRRLIDEQEQRDIGGARSEALSRGLTGDPFEASAVGMARQDRGRKLLDLETNLASEAFGQSREDRLLREARAFTTSEREGSQGFSAAETEKNRRFQSGESALNRDFASRESAVEREFRDRLRQKQEELQLEMQTRHHQYGSGPYGGGGGGSDLAAYLNAGSSVAAIVSAIANI